MKQINLTKFELSLITSTLFSLLIGLSTGRPVGYSYAKFTGPVSGPEKEIYVKDPHGGGHVDYIAKADYQFAYGVDDPKTKVLQNRKESRHGDNVKGEYSVVEPDGTLRVVKYTADKINGFQAEVITDGKSEIHGRDQPAPTAPAPPSYNYHDNPSAYHAPPPPQSTSYDSRHPYNNHQTHQNNYNEDDEEDGEGGSASGEESGEEEEY